MIINNEYELTKRIIKWSIISAISTIILLFLLVGLDRITVTKQLDNNKTNFEKELPREIKHYKGDVTFVFYRDDCIDCQKLLPRIKTYNDFIGKRTYYVDTNLNNKEYIGSFGIRKVPSSIKLLRQKGKMVYKVTDFYSEKHIKKLFNQYILNLIILFLMINLVSLLVFILLEKDIVRANNHEKNISTFYY